MQGLNTWQIAVPAYNRLIQATAQKAPNAAFNPSFSAFHFNLTLPFSIYSYISRINQNAPANKLSLNLTTPTRALNPAYRKEKVIRQAVEALKEQL